MKFDEIVRNVLSASGSGATLENGGIRVSSNPLFQNSTSGMSGLYAAIKNSMTQNGGKLVRNLDNSHQPFTSNDYAPSGRFVSRLPIKDRFYHGNEFGTASKQENVSETALFVDGMDDPTSLTFKVEFGEWGASILEMKQVANIQAHAVDTNLYLSVYDNMPMGLLDLNFIDPDKMVELWAGQVCYNAYNYLLNRNEDRRAQYAKDFIEGLYILQKDMPYIFNKISGLDKLGDFDALRGQRLKDAELKIECLPDGMDWKIRHLMELYRKFAWDDVWQRWVLPDIYRYFRMIIYIYDKRILKTRYGEFDPVQDYLPVLALECSPCEFVIGNLWGNDFTQNYMEANTPAPSFSIKVHNIKTYYANTLMNRVKFIKDIRTFDEHKFANDTAEASKNGRTIAWQFEWLQNLFMHNEEYHLYSPKYNNLSHFPGDELDYSTDYSEGHRIEQAPDSWHSATVSDYPYIIRSWKDFKEAVKGIVLSNTKVIRDSRQPDKYYYTNDLSRLSPEMFAYYYKRNWLQIDDNNIQKQLQQRLKDMLRQMKKLLLADIQIPDQEFVNMNPETDIPSQKFRNMIIDDVSVRMKDISLIEGNVPDMEYAQLFDSSVPHMDFNHMKIDTSLPDLEYAHLKPNEVPDMDFMQMDPKDVSFQLQPVSLIEGEVGPQQFAHLVPNYPGTMDFLHLIGNTVPDMDFLQMWINLEKAKMQFLELIPNELPELEFAHLIETELGHMEFLHLLPVLDKALMEFLQIVPNSVPEQEFLNMVLDTHKAIMDFLTIVPNEPGTMDFLQMLPNLEKAVLDFLQLMPDYEKATMPWLQLMPDYEKVHSNFTRLIIDLEKALQQYATMNIDEETPDMDFMTLKENIVRLKQNFATLLVDMSKAKLQYLEMNPDTVKPDMDMTNLQEMDEKAAMQMVDMIVDQYVEHSQMQTPIIDVVKAHTDFVQMVPETIKSQSPIQLNMTEPSVGHADFLQMNPYTEIEHGQMASLIPNEEIAHTDFVRLTPYTEHEHSQMAQMVVEERIPEGQMTSLILNEEIEHSQMLQMVINEIKEHRDFVQMNLNTSVGHSDMTNLVVNEEVAHTDFVKMNPELEIEHAQMTNLISNEEVTHTDFVQMKPDIEKSEMKFVQPELVEKPELQMQGIEIKELEITHSQLVSMEISEGQKPELKTVSLEKAEYEPQMNWNHMAEVENPSLIMKDISLNGLEVRHSEFVHMKNNQEEIRHSDFVGLEIDSSLSHAPFPKMIDNDVSARLRDVAIENREKDIKDEISVKLNEGTAKSITEKDKEDINNALSGAKIQISPKLKEKMEDLVMIDPGKLHEESTETLIKLVDLLEGTLNEAKRELKLQAPVIIGGKRQTQLIVPKLEKAKPHGLMTLEKEFKMPDMAAMERAERLQWEHSERNKNNHKHSQYD